MGFVVHLGQMIKIQLGINLGGGKAVVAEQFLHRADVAAGLQQVAGVAVAQHVRREVLWAALADCPVFQPVLNLALAEAAAVAVGEEGGFACGGLALR